MFLLDTNALVYAVQAASPFYARGRDRVSHARRDASPAFVTLTAWNVNRYACRYPAGDSIAGPTPRKGRFSFGCGSFA